MKPSHRRPLNHIAAWVLLSILIVPSLVAVSGVAHCQDLPVAAVGRRVAAAFPTICSPAPNGSRASAKARHRRRGLGRSPRCSARWRPSACGASRAAFVEVVRAFLLLPLIVPPIISAMAFYRWWVPLGLIDSYLGIILAHAILAVPLVLITVSASLANFDLRLEQASRSLGASLSTTLRRVILPSIRPGILAGAVFAFILSWDEIVVTLFISKFDRLHPAAPHVERHPRKHRPDGRRRRGGPDLAQLSASSSASRSCQRRAARKPPEPSGESP